LTSRSIGRAGVLIAKLTTAPVTDRVSLGPAIWAGTFVG
jgi:hypothetical protein